MCVCEWLAAQNESVEMFCNEKRKIMFKTSALSLSRAEWKQNKKKREEKNNKNNNNNNAWLNCNELRK